MSRALLAVALLVVVAACGDSDTSTGFESPRTMTLQVTGGIAGIDDTTVFHDDGRIELPTGNNAAVDARRIAEVLDFAATAGFFAWDGSYLPEDQCCDRFTYAVTFTSGEESHTVVTIDAAESAPADLWDLIGRLGELVATAG